MNYIQKFALKAAKTAGFQFETDNEGQIVLYTGLMYRDDGSVVDMEKEVNSEQLPDNS